MSPRARRPGAEDHPRTPVHMRVVAHPRSLLSGAACASAGFQPAGALMSDVVAFHGSVVAAPFILKRGGSRAWQQPRAARR